MAQARFRAINGTRDYFDADGVRFDKAAAAAADLFGRYGYSRIRTPVFEATELFARSIGAATDIVEKEMYTFSPGSESITLRPENTAGVLRAYLQHSMDKRQGLVKLWYEGPMFRHEHPQKGRQRQFHQVGVEAVGSGDPLLDVEIVALGIRYYELLGITGVGLRLNSIGCNRPECRPGFREKLRDAIRPNLDRYCRNCQARFERNVLRVIDCKNPGCRELAADLPRSHENLCEECSGHFDAVRSGLDALGIAYQLDHTLVRGLDYYAKTVFEYTHGALGAQNAIGGGGRYDGLAEELGGNPTPGIGFALGVERILIAMEALGLAAAAPALDVFGVTQGDAARRAMSGLLAALRGAGHSADMDYEGRSMKSQMRTANRRMARCCLILGEGELESGTVTVKDMRDGGAQESVPADGFLEAVRKVLS